jgi:hypothetical protein
MMKLELNVRGPDGTNQTVHGEALPLHDRPIVSPGTTVNLGQADFERLKLATLRLRRCAIALENLGTINLSFSMRQGFVADRPINDLMLKALALEARPFFLNDDQLYFQALVKLKSFGVNLELARTFRGHTKRWKTCAFNGVMSMSVEGHTLDTEKVVSTWFNSDLFHTGPMKAEEISLTKLEDMLGGSSQAQAILALHLTSSLSIVKEFLMDVAAISSQFRSWVEGLPKNSTT